MEKNSAPRLPARAFVEADVTNVFWIGCADVEILVEEALRGVGVGIHDNCGVVDGASLRRHRLCGQSRRQKQEEGDPENVHGFGDAERFYMVERWCVRVLCSEENSRSLDSVNVSQAKPFTPLGMTRTVEGAR